MVKSVAWVSPETFARIVAENPGKVAVYGKPPTKRQPASDTPAKLTKAMWALMEYLGEAPDAYLACERVCHPNTAAALERRGLLTIEDGDGGFRPWFDCRLTPAGRRTLTEAHGRHAAKAQRRTRAGLTT